MRRPFVAATHWKMLWGIMECSLQCFFLIRLMLIYILGVEISSSFFPEVRWFQHFFFKKTFYIFFLRVENAFLAPILEPKNGITAKKLGSKIPLCRFHFRTQNGPSGGLKQLERIKILHHQVHHVKPTMSISSPKPALVEALQDMHLSGRGKMQTN